MKLILTQPEIEMALTRHIFDTIALKDGQKIEIDFTATRGDAGLTATVDIPYMGVSQIDLDSKPAVAPAEEAEAAPAKRGRPKQKPNMFELAGDESNAVDTSANSIDALETANEIIGDQSNNEAMTEVPATETKASIFGN